MLERPVSIDYFARAVVLGIGLGLLNTYLIWDEMAARIADLGFGPGFILGVQATSYAVVLLLLWFIAHRRSNVARWIYVALAGFGILSGLAGLEETLALDRLLIAITAAQYLISLVTIVLLFRPDARLWFDRRRIPVDAEIFR